MIHHALPCGCTTNTVNICHDHWRPHAKSVQRPTGDAGQEAAPRPAVHTLRPLLHGHALRDRAARLRDGHRSVPRPEVRCPKCGKTTESYSTGLKCGDCLMNTCDVVEMVVVEEKKK
jgi:hypothetical protein